MLGGGMLDVSPESVAIPEYRAWQCGHRNSTGVVGNQSWPELVMMDGNQPWMSARADTGDPGGSGAQPNKTCAGVFLYTPIMVCTNIATDDPRWVGRLYQCLRCSDELGPGSEVTVPVDSGVTGVFRVIGRDAAGGCGMCVRKA